VTELHALPTFVEGDTFAVRSVMDFDERIRHELAQFFVAAVAFEGKNLSILGWDGPEDALNQIRELQELPATSR
jgi:hypothetical protein